MRSPIGSRSSFALLLSLALLGPGRAALAVIPEPPPSLETLFARVARLPGVEARFQEERRVALLRAPLQSEGEVFFVPPDRLARRTDRPIPSLLLVDGDRLWFGDAEHHASVDLDANPVLRPLLEGVRTVLAGDLDALRRNYDLEFIPREATGGWCLRLKPKLELLARVLARIEVHGVDVRLSEVRVTETRGDETLTRFSEVDTHRHFSADELSRLFDASMH